MGNHHLIISGTGRSGTSLLVKFLDACGLDSPLGKNRGVFWDKSAQAGIESNILLEPDLPYVVKAPWHDMRIAEAVAAKGLVIDAALLPVRDLAQAAASRIVLDLRHRYEHLPELLDMPRVDSFGYIAGGCIYSMNPIDQAREAALGFHRLLLELATLEIPAIFLEFPRFATDFGYLYRQVAAFLPPETSRESAEKIFNSLVDPDSLRMEREMKGESGPKKPQMYLGAAFPSLEELDNIALKRRLKEVQKENQRLAESNVSLAATEARLTESNARLAATEARLTESNARLATTEANLAGTHTRLSHAEALLKALHASRSWRITAPLRAIANHLRKKQA